ncbi:M23 family metallopeptidase [Brevibacillus humidisoli]|uniref:LysM peptidoglycan-binding domain-containing M23 family metallopeptidase n=1 Tax=Brevibacillus humidisoli TaxID=2895522 RepID=UPI001E36A166|nr:M23 family metallopeptidase [Brevibacillus humidisoli]UFJ40420.1 M23 family metallopeptidase [Brevibacillus humidisoli]
MDFAKWKAWLQRRVSPFFRHIGHQVKNIVIQIRTYIQAHKKQTATVAIAATVGMSGAAYADYYYESNIISIYHVYVNGKEIGVVNSPEVIEKWTEDKLREESSKHHGLTLKMSDYITYKEERIYKGEYDNEAALTALSQIADIKVEAVKIVVDGKLVGYAASPEDAKTVFNHLKEKYVKPPAAEEKKQTVQAASIEATPASAGVTGADASIKEVRFKEQVTTETDSVPAAQILSVDKLEELLSKGTFKDVIHTVQEGDCITCIAEKYGITSKDIYANNPGITEDTVLQLGQKINVTAIKPLVTVQVVEELEREEVIDYTVQTRNNDQMPQGDTKVIQEGQEGKKRVRYQVIKENGQEVAREVLEQEILSEPVPKIVERGTKVIPSRGTGRFSWPAKGYISSGFGMRWGRMHQGIDIAGSGSIRAADNGRVVSAGWNGGYGNAVIIDHGNGYQTLYGHMRSISVKVGQVVSKGKVIGVMGSTGNSTGVHLHFEVRKNGSAQNPLRYLGR